MTTTDNETGPRRKRAGQGAAKNAAKGAAKGARTTGSAAERKLPAARGGFTKEERAAMRERAAETRRAKAGADGEAELLAKLRELKGSDRAIGEALHRIVMEAAPALVPRTWYGMPAWARDGKVLCFYQPAGKFKARYATLGFSDEARLDDGAFWPTAFGIADVTPAVEREVVRLVRRAMG